MNRAQSATDKATGQMQKGLDRVDSALKKIGKAAAAYISVRAVVNFSKECVQLGSDLTEVQNVVDVTFGSLSGKVDTFAKSAIKSFGLSETAAKKYSSTMGAMLKSMGITTDKAYDMSTQLTGLAGDMASFYNLDADTAFQKIRAGISGETEPLKQLGINMSVANLEAYALSQGITKSYQAMTQAEQATLRYNYLLSTTKDAQGDFARTADTWANQTKILSMQFDSLKASLGQGLIMALTPVIKVINQIISKLVQLADAFKQLMADITGTDLSTSTSNTAENLSDATDAAKNVGEALVDGAEAADKAAKRYLMSFDEIHKVGAEDNDLINTDALDALANGEAGYAMEELVDATQTENDLLGGLNDKFQPIIVRMKELGGLFKEGFDSSVGANFKERIDGLVEDAQSGWKSLKDIFTDDGVLGSAKGFLDNFTGALGSAVGSAVSIGTSIGEGVIGGISQYLRENGGKIKEHLKTMFDIGGDTFSTLKETFGSIASILEPLGGENGQGLVSNIIGAFSEGYMGIRELTGKLRRDVVGILSKPITMNTEAIREAFDGILEVAKKISGTVKEIVGFVRTKANDVYDKHLKPLFDKIGNGLGKAFGKFLNVWNSNIKPMLDRFASTIQKLWERHLKPFFDKLGDAIGTVFDFISMVWENVLQPLLEWLWSDLIKKFIPVVEGAFNGIVTAIGHILDVLSGLWDILKGFFDFVIGIFTGDWERAWKGAGEIVDGVCSSIKGFIDGAVDLLATLFGWIWDIVKAIGGALADAVKWILDLLGVIDEDDSPSGNYTLADAEAAGKTHPQSGTVTTAIQSETTSNPATYDVLYGAYKAAIEDADVGDSNIYMDGEQVGIITDKARYLRQSRVNPNVESAR